MKHPGEVVSARESLTPSDDASKGAQPASTGFESGGAVVIRWWAALASLAAGLIHLTVVSEHVNESWLHGGFFVVLGVAQIAWAVLAMASDRLPFPRTFAMVNAAVICIWIVSRTSGLPVPPQPWEVEPVGVADLACTVLEAAVVLLLIWAPRRAPARQPASLTRGQRVLIAVGVLITAAVTAVALIANPPFIRMNHTHGTHSVHDLEESP